jgi:ABC-type transporter Mla MlaB component
VKIERNLQADTTVLTLSGDLTFETVGPVRSAYLEAADDPTVEINFSDLQNIDLAGLQVLYSIQKDRKGTGKTLEFSGDKGLQRLGRMAEFAGFPPLESSDPGTDL